LKSIYSYVTKIIKGAPLNTETQLIIETGSENLRKMNLIYINLSYSLTNSTNMVITPNFL